MDPMDALGFDALIKKFAAGPRSRRGALWTLATGVGLIALGTLSQDANAKKKKKKKKKPPTCGGGETQCPAGYPASCCPAGTTCCQSRLACCPL